jgi:hypothetical protein
VFALSSVRQGIAFSADSFGEFGYNIGDVLSDTFSPATSYLALHRNGADVGIFVSNGTDSIARFNPTSGAWSPVAEPVNGCGPIASLETSEAVRTLLTTINGYICGRDLDTFTDGHSASTYTAFGTIGSIDLAPMALSTTAIRHVFARTTATGSRASISILQNNISGTFSDIARACSVPARLSNTSVESTTVPQV